MYIYIFYLYSDIHYEPLVNLALLQQGVFRNERLLDLTTDLLDIGREEREFYDDEDEDKENFENNITNEEILRLHTSKCELRNLGLQYSDYEDLSKAMIDLSAVMKKQKRRYVVQPSVLITLTGKTGNDILERIKNKIMFALRDKLGNIYIQFKCMYIYT